MSALKPIDNARVLGVAAEAYPLNRTCAHPECKEAAVDPHHCFPRSQQIGGSYFVAITFDTNEEAKTFGNVMGVKPLKTTPQVVVIPHVVGLCRQHHDWVEEHFAWVKLDLETGVWSWWETNDRKDGGDAFAEVGPLNPQPGSVEGKPKRKRFKGEARRTRRTISFRVPDDAGEDGAALLDEKIDAMRSLVGDDSRPPYYVFSDALDYTLLNADKTDFDE